jgi:acetyl-CoA C-acetyltransferase
VSPRDAYVVAARRSPIGRIGGSLRNLRVESLAAPVIRAVLADAGLAPADVDDVVLGNAWGPGGNPARLAALAAGLDPGVPGLTVDRQCASGLEAVNLAARLVASGAADVCLAGGVESPSTAPWRVERPATAYATPVFTGRARFAPDPAGDPDMGPAADALARACGVSRERQDAFALASHRKAAAAARAGRFEGEIVAMPASDRAATSGVPPEPASAVTEDQSPRPRLTLDVLARFPPVFGQDGTVTAGNASPVNDGAAVVAVVSAAVRDRLPPAPALRFAGGAAAGVDPALPGSGPVAATRALLERAPVGLDAIDLVELTEAFAAQALACLDTLGVDALGRDEQRVNVGGGAIALGHPWGASGAVLVVRLYTEIVRRPASAPAPRYGLATIAGAGGVGVATLLERVA